jgi:hypothetical protein
MRLRFSTRRSKSSATGSGPGLAFGLFWTAFSSIFVAAGVGMAWSSLGTLAWDKVPCVVERFEIREDPAKNEPFTAEVSFRYEAAGKMRTGTKLTSSGGGRSDYHKLAELRERFFAGGAPATDPFAVEAPAGPRREPAQCRVNPADPDDAVLLADTGGIWGGLIFATFGGCFVAIGIGMIVASRSASKAAKIGARTAAPAGNDSPRAILFPFFFLFGAAGLGVLLGLVVPAWFQFFSARTWVETPATVVWSRVRSHSDSDGTTYSADVFYRYEFNGREYRSNRRSFFSGSSSGHAGKQNTVDEHPPGKPIVCYANPRRPWEAVLERGLGWWALFTLFPLPFLAVGFFGLRWLLRGGGTPGKAARGGKSARGAAARTADGTAAAFAGKAGAAPWSTVAGGRPGGEARDLPPAPGRRARFFFMLAAALFWNGIVSVFLVNVVSEWRGGSGPWFLTLFLVPFVVVGLGLIAAWLASAGALFNPRPHVRLDPGEPVLGQMLSVSWEIPQGAGRLRRLSIRLTGEEVASYRRGTSTVTERQAFFDGELAEATHARLIEAGRASLRLPTGLPPTWQATNNRIEWTLRVTGEIALWPDLDDSHVITIHPAPPGHGSEA